jgi:O-acetyl-ADP-ribose deacetylase
MPVTLSSYTLPGDRILEIVRGDITQETSDAIVNAANSYLAHGAGVAGAIAARGGQLVVEESANWVKKHGPVSHEHPAWTHAGNLPCRYVIHAVGPIWGSGGEDAKLGAAVKGSLERAEELKLASISFPAISTGIFGFPVERAARVILTSLAAWANEHPSAGLKRIRLVLFDADTAQTFKSSAQVCLG